MKNFMILFGIISLVCLIGGLFGKTPDGEPATHVLLLFVFCAALTLLFYLEHKKNKNDANR